MMADGNTYSGETDIDHYKNWLPDGAWHGVYAGSFFPGSGLSGYGVVGRYWVARATQAANAEHVSISASSLSFAPMAKYSGYAVRCVANN
jgi:hypothetical protein